MKLRHIIGSTAIGDLPGNGAGTITRALAATEAIDSLERVAPLRAAMPPKVRATKPMLPPAPIGVPPSTTASRT